MNLWDFLDRRHQRLLRSRELTVGSERRSTFRYTVGLLAVVGGLLGLFLLYFVAVPEGNMEPMLLALGVVLGWGGAVVSGEWGSSPAGRGVAEVGVEASRKAAEAPAGTAGDPLNIQGAPPGTPPVHTKAQGSLAGKRGKPDG